MLTCELLLVCVLYVYVHICVCACVYVRFVITFLEESKITVMLGLMPVQDQEHLGRE